MAKVLCSDCKSKSAVPEGKCTLAHTCYDPVGPVQCEDFGQYHPRVNGRYCFHVMRTVLGANGEYRALIVKENEPGYNLTDWTWGKDFKDAELIAAKRNARLGLSPQQCQDIVDSSIMAQMRREGAARKAQQKPRRQKRQSRPRLTR